MENGEKPITRRDIILSLIVAGSVLLAMFIVNWAKEPNFRPLVQDIRLVDSVKIADVLDQNRIPYFVDIPSHMIFVTENAHLDARFALARAGIEIDYPKFEHVKSNAEVCSTIRESIESKGEFTNVPLWQQPWFMRALKLVMGGLIIIVLILAIVRPALRELIYPTDKDT